MRDYGSAAPPCGQVHDGVPCPQPRQNDLNGCWNHYGPETDPDAHYQCDATKHLPGQVPCPHCEPIANRPALAEDAADAHHQATWKPTTPPKRPGFWFLDDPARASLLGAALAARDGLLSGQPTGLPDGTSTEYVAWAESTRDDVESARADGRATWALLLEADHHQVLAEVDVLALRGLLVKLTGTALAWVADIDDRARAAARNPFVATVVQ
jgi:hypothetical protein